jgi:hypothetical protein
MEVWGFVLSEKMLRQGYEVGSVDGKDQPPQA